jgi:tetratricopeptide (TPR) repeat protein
MSGRLAPLSRAIVAALMLIACMDSAAHAEKRVALVVGNSAYQNAVKLPNPGNDAKLMSDTLLSLGFFVVGGGARLDLDKAGFDAALKEFSEQLIGADAALFYYAGHGVEIRGLNYLVPIDADPKEEADILSQMTSLAGILDQMQKSGARINIALLDACRNNPFRMHLATEGLAQMQAPPGTLISFATQPRNVALDGDNGHSPYTRALAATMTHPGYGLFKTFNEVGLAVEKDTHGAQLPWVSSSPISGNFYFAGKPAPTQVNLPSPDTPVQAAALATPADASSRNDLVTSCDWLAAMPFDVGKPPEVPGVESGKIDVKSANAACADAMQRYPDVMRFVFEAGRVAYAKNDYADARRLYLKADQGGYRLAASSIGLLYAEGKGVGKDAAEAARWFKKSVDAGEPVAMSNLGLMYQNGEGVAKDCPEALRLYQTAGKAGLASVIYEMGRMYHTGDCVQRDYAKALRLYSQAASLGDGPAMNNLGILYNDGRGVPRDRKLAKQWFEKAAALGVPEAKQNLKGM